MKVALLDGGPRRSPPTTATLIVAPASLAARGMDVSFASEPAPADADPKPGTACASASRRASGTVTAVEMPWNVPSLNWSRFRARNRTDLTADAGTPEAAPTSS